MEEKVHHSLHKKKKEIDRFLESCISILTFNLKIFSNDFENFI